MVTFDHVSFGYPAAVPGWEPERIVNGVSFHIKEGEFAALIGENGAGKSTLCRLASGLLRPTAGKVTVCGLDTAAEKPSALARKIGYLFQNPDRQICQNTVREEIRFGLEYALEGVFSTAAEREREMDARCEEMLALFGLDGSRAPFGLSRGERQQCALASVLARRPRLLILDEPTTGLDYRECVAIMEHIGRLHEKGATIIMISHDMEVVGDCAQRALVLSRGRLVGEGPVREAVKNRRLLDAASLLPPQIPALAMELGAGFEEVYTVDDMVEAVTLPRLELRPPQHKE